MSGISTASVLLVIVITLCAVLSCGDSGNEETKGDTDPISQDVMISPQNNTVITLGNYTDLTGPASNPMGMVNMALEDIVKYYNDEDLIPGVELEVISYDGQTNPSRDIPGYEWLIERGADLIFNAAPSASVALKSRVDDDHIMFFAITPDEKSLSPPGYVFCIGNTLGNYQSYTLLKWLAENDDDFPDDRPAKVGCAFWAEGYGQSFLNGLKDYAETNPDQYEWGGGYLTNFTFAWGPEADLLKDCDYVMPPCLMQNFIKDYREAGYDAKFIGTDFQIASLNTLSDLDLWGEADGMILVRPGHWWNEDGEVIGLAKTLLNKNHPKDAEYVMSTGPGYQVFGGVYIILEILRNTIEVTGPENFNSEAFYEIAQSHSLTIDDVQMHSYSKTKRTSLDRMGLYVLSGAQQDLVRLDPEWIPVVYTP